MLKLNPKWSLADGEADKDLRRGAILDYAQHASGVPKVLGVWAKTAASHTDIYTMIEDDNATERAVYDVELLVLDKWPDIQVQFHVYRDQEVFKQQVTGAEQILLAAIPLT